MSQRPTSSRGNVVSIPGVRPHAQEEAGEPRPYSRLPSVDAVLSSNMELAAFSRSSAVAAVREAISVERERIRSGESADVCDPDAIALRSLELLRARARPRLGRVVNATGIVLHTNLGRARLSTAAIDAVRLAACGEVNLEYDLARGERGERDELVEEHLCDLTGAEAATVVNNNAAAVFLVLNTLASGKDVVVSRGELVEIGGSFRIPDIMAASGARLREVGTTNRTHLSDYRKAIGPDVALLMKVHASNYRIVGFTSSVGLDELAALAAGHPEIHVIEDLGSGAVVDLQPFGLAEEPLIGERIRAGADLVLASGDKLLGGPQCGIIAGRRELVDRLRMNPLRRALRCDKMTLAALEATLRTYRFSTSPQHDIPVLRFLARSVGELRAIGERAIALLEEKLAPRFSFELVASSARAGSGSQPDHPIASLAIAVRAGDLDAVAIERMFRTSEPPILGRIERDVFLLDLRVIDAPDDLVPAVPDAPAR
ncbi:MAG TPA: L-seryl-tRNA(Sec) selenium transferase [Candidatus Limnocylindrales bacterium]|nr:L-seryl-tRNA(Sec) selenium transferase [Candidatus Limnocylindrales bacterium]